MGSGSRRSFLFLQGLSTPFFVRLGRAVAARGHAVHRINLSFGDRLFWPRLGAVDYRGRFADWRVYLDGFLARSGVTDIVLFGDCRPYHRVARDLAARRGIAVHVFEEGYFRPDWVTLERQGTNALSDLPRRPDAILGAAAAIAEREQARLAAGDAVAEAGHEAVGGGFARRVAWELLNQFAILLASPLYPNYRRHRSCHPMRELAGWFKRAVIRRPLERLYARRVSAYLAGPACRRPYWLLPLQLESDYQIRRHSPFRTMAAVMETVLTSFAAAAPADALLVIKLHPLDNGLVNVRRRAARLARRLRLGNRVLVIDGGHLPTLISGSRGMVVVNSTAGLSGLYHGRPVKVLGEALFDVAGLTAQMPLDRFWREAQAPDEALFRAFRRVVMKRAQLNGSFFTRRGMQLAVQGAVDRLGAVDLRPQATASAAGVPVAIAGITVRTEAENSPIAALARN